jgi:acyl dehydratase
MTLTLANLQHYLHKEVGVSEWLTIDQERIDRFADCTGDFQWIHVDAERAKDGPYGATVAHGFLTLSLIPLLAKSVWAAQTGIKASFNYGLNRVRFAAPVRCGDRIRDRIGLVAIEERGEGRKLLTMDHTIEIEGQEKPALVATTLAMVQG